MTSSSGRTPTLGHVSLDSLKLEARDGRTIARMRSVFQSVRDRDAMIDNRMEHRGNEGFERLDELFATMATTPVN